MLHLSFNPGRNKYFLTSFHNGVKVYLQTFEVYFAKMFYKKARFVCSYYIVKTILLDLISNKNKMFNFQTFKVVLLATINSIFVTALLLVNFYTVLLLKIYDQRRQLDIFLKDAIISRNIAFERVTRLKSR